MKLKLLLMYADDDFYYLDHNLELKNISVVYDSPADTFYAIYADFWRLPNITLDDNYYDSPYRRVYHKKLI